MHLGSNYCRNGKYWHEYSLKEIGFVRVHLVMKEEAIFATSAGEN